MTVNEINTIEKLKQYLVDSTKNSKRIWEKLGL